MEASRALEPARAGGGPWPRRVEAAALRVWRAEAEEAARPGGLRSPRLGRRRMAGEEDGPPRPRESRAARPGGLRSPRPERCPTAREVDGPTRHRGAEAAHRGRAEREVWPDGHRSPRRECSGRWGAREAAAHRAPEVSWRRWPARYRTRGEPGAPPARRSRALAWRSAKRAARRRLEGPGVFRRRCGEAGTSCSPTSSCHWQQRGDRHHAPPAASACWPRWSAGCPPPTCPRTWSAWWTSSAPCPRPRPTRSPGRRC